MKRIATKFLLAVGVFATLFAVFVLLRTWYAVRQHAEDLTSTQAHLAIQFDLAIRQYIAHQVRPQMQSRAGKEEFLPETMSSSFAARNVFDEVRKHFPDYILKFSSDNPRNPANAAGPEELKLLQYFRDHPQETDWRGSVEISGKTYLVHCIPRRMERECLQCHGHPDDAPASLVLRYGGSAGFHRPLGDVIALDTVGIPLDRVQSRIASEARNQFLVMAAGGAILFAAVFLAFRYLVAKRLAAITRHFQRASQQPLGAQMAPIEVSGKDEISVLAESYNALAAQLHASQALLEQRVAERTATLQQEVAQRAQIEDALRESERKLSMLLGNMPGMAYRCLNDDFWTMEFVSEGCRKLTGYSPADLSGNHKISYEQLIHPDDREKVRVTVRQALATHQPYQLEYRLRTAANKEIWVWEQGLGLFADDGTLHALEGFIWDITARKCAQQRLWRSEERYRLLAENVQDVIWTANLQLKPTYISPSVERLCGYKAEQVMELGFQPILTPAASQLANQTLAATLAKANDDPSVLTQPVYLEMEMIRRDGSTVWTEVNTSFLCDPQGRPTGIIGITRDISDRKRIEKELEQARMAAETANRVKSEFLANMSHEIRTPMTAILGYIDLLSEGCARRCPFTHSEVGNPIDVVRRNAHHLIQLINDVLDLSKIEAGRLEVERTACSPCAIVADVASLMRVRAIAKGLRLDVEFHGDLPERIYTDPTRLRQILMNTVGNAVKFTDAGSVRLITRLHPSDDGATLNIQVVDTGIGMSDEMLGRLFTAFSQADSSTSRRFGGTGLGLAISKRLAEQLGGSLSVSSSLGQGSTFTLSLPTGPLDATRMLQSPTEAQFQANEQRPNTQQARPSLPPGCRVLLAEDGPDNQRLISFVLRKAGAEVTVADHGQAAVEAALAARTQGQPFDLILMDMQMPVMDGYTAVKHLRAQQWSGPIVALTAHAMTHDRQHCLDAGCDDYVPKPIDRDQLVSLVARYVSHHPLATRPD